MHRWHPSLVLYRKTKLTLHAEHYSFHVRNQLAHLCMPQSSSRGLPVPVGDRDVINISSIKRATRPSMTELNPPRTRRRKSNFTAACAKLTRRRRRHAALPPGIMGLLPVRAAAHFLPRRGLVRGHNKSTARWKYRMRTPSL